MLVYTLVSLSKSSKSVTVNEIKHCSCFWGSVCMHVCMEGAYKWWEMPGKKWVIIGSLNSIKYAADGWNVSRNSHCRQLHEEIFQSKEPKGKKQTVFKSISSLPRTKDTWGLFDKPVLKRLHMLSFACHALNKAMVGALKSIPALRVGSLCQVNSRGSSCL